LRRTFAWAGAAAALVFAAALLVVLVTRGGGTSGDSPATSDSPGPVVTSPYDFTEADTPPDFTGFGDAKFISLTLETPNSLRSYLLAHDSAGFATLVAALAGARETVVSAPAPGLTTLAQEELGPSLTVVMEDRTTYTFVLDLEGDALIRGAQAWRLPDDLKTLVDRATAE
jgi:hypothetical protein